ncbi:MAG: hypothetical protein CMK07_15060 [Ponticaulis sp.]|nr:hypothetical protein [Ponticaulis sp.]
MANYTFQQANRRYRSVFFPLIALYVVACIGGALLLKTMEVPPVWLKPVVAVFTVAPIFGVFWLVWRYIQETDEYTRLRQLEALSIGGMTCASATGVVGFLELYDAIPADAVPTFLFLPVFFFSWGVTKWLRGAGGC